MKALYWMPVALLLTTLPLSGCNDDNKNASTQAPQAATQQEITETTAAQATGESPTDSAQAANTTTDKAESKSDYFQPPALSDIPDNAFGDMVRLGHNIFTQTNKYAGEYAGNQLNCDNCHLNAGRRPNSAPLWAAWGRYPRYRSKNDKVNTFTDRLQGCFMFSMNGEAPPADSKIITALTSYAYWLAQGAPTGKDLKGVGYPKQGYEPPAPPSYERGKAVYASHCALCHGENGQGQKVLPDEYVFPPLWGADSYNWGAGMHSVKTAATFIKYNMPFSRGGTLTDQQAWDVAYFIDSHERPQDPRFTGDIAETRKLYHNSKWSLYGTKVNGHLLGQGVSAN